MVDGVKGSGTPDFNARAVLNDLLKKSGGGSTIKADVWNEYAQSHGGKTIKKFINTSDAIASINAYQKKEEIMASIKFEEPPIEHLEIGPDGKQITPQDEIKLEDVTNNYSVGQFAASPNDKVSDAVLKAKNEIAAPQAISQEKTTGKLTAAEEKDMNGRHAQLLAKFPEGHPIRDQIIRGINDERLKAGLPPIEDNETQTKPAPMLAANQPTTKTENPIGQFAASPNDKVSDAVLKAKNEIAAPEQKQEEKVPFVLPEIQEMNTKHQQIIENINKLSPEYRERAAARLYSAMNQERAEHPEYNLPPLKNPYENTDS